MDIIPRYLDSNLDRAELDHLAADLLGDRELAAEFARAARLDHALEVTFTDDARAAELGGLIALLEKQDAPPKTIPRIAIFAAAAAIALAIAIIQLWPGNPSADPPISADSRPAGKRIQRPSVRLPQTRLTAILPRENAPDAEAEALLRQRLSRFYLPATNIDSLPLDEALASLEQSFQSSDQLVGEPGDAVPFELGGDIDDPPAVSLARSNISVLSALNLLALQAGFELTFAPPAIRLIPAAEPVDKAGSDSELLTETYQLSPALFTAGPYRDSPPSHFSPDDSLLMTPSADGSVRIWDVETGEVVTDLSHPPDVEAVQFSEDGKLVKAPAPDSEATRILNKESGQPVSGSPGQVWSATKSDLQTIWGLELSDSESGSYFPSTGALVLRSSQANRDLFAALLQEANGSSSSSSPVTIVTKLISLPDELAGTTDRIVNAEEWQPIIRAWRDQRGVDIMTAPSITAHIGTEASARIITTRSVEVNQEPGENFGEVTADRSTGLRLPFTTSAAGEQITIRGRIEQSISEDSLAPEMLEQLGGSDLDAPIVHFHTEVEAPLFAGQVAIFECEPHEPGRKMIAAVSVSWGIPSPAPPETTEPSLNE